MIFYFSSSETLTDFTGANYGLELDFLYGGNTYDDDELLLLLPATDTIDIAGFLTCSLLYEKPELLKLGLLLLILLFYETTLFVSEDESPCDL